LEAVKRNICAIKYVLYMTPEIYEYVKENIKI